MGRIESNKAYKLYEHPEGSYVVSLAASPNGQAIICGHMDGSIFKFTFPQVCTPTPTNVYLSVPCTGTFCIYCLPSPNGHMGGSILKFMFPQGHICV